MSAEWEADGDYARPCLRECIRARVTRARAFSRNVPRNPRPSVLRLRNDYEFRRDRRRRVLEKLREESNTRRRERETGIPRPERITLKARATTRARLREWSCPRVTSIPDAFDELPSDKYWCYGQISDTSFESIVLFSRDGETPMQSPSTNFDAADA